MLVQIYANNWAGVYAVHEEGLSLTLKQVFSFLYLTLKFDHEVFWVGKE